MRAIYLFILLVLNVHLFSQCKDNGSCRIAEQDGGYTTGKNKKGKRVGTWQSFYANGILRESTQYHQGEKHGEYISYHENGVLRSRGQYEHNKRNARWYTFHSNGDTAATETFLNDTLHGYWARYTIFSIGHSEKGYYKNGKRDGWWTITGPVNPNRSLDSCHYDSGMRTGTWKTYVDGRLELVRHFVNDAEHGVRIRYHNGTEAIQTIGYYKSGKRDSVLLEYSTRGTKLRRAYYVDGLASGYDSSWNASGILTFVTYYSSPGQIASITAWTYNGRLQSKKCYSKPEQIDSLIYYYPNGSVQSREHHHKVNYPGNDTIPPIRYSSVMQRNYYSNGKLMMETNFIDNRRSGPYAEYDSSGRMTRSGYYENDAFTGTWRSYNSSGVITGAINYNANEAVGEYKSWYDNGKLRVRGLCRDGYVRDSVRAWTSSGKEAKQGTALYDSLIAQNFRAEKYIAYMHPSTPVPTPKVWIDDPSPKLSQETSVDEVFTFTETIPEFPGGNDSLHAYLRRNLRYPQQEKENGKSGTIYVQFVVEKDGTLSDIRAVKQVNGAPGLSKEAMRVVQSMPKWTPGKMNGRPVRVQYTLPVKFTLQ